MKQKHFLALTFGAAIAAVMPQRAQAAAVVGTLSESFSDYSVGASFTSQTLPSTAQNGGTGWNSTGDSAVANDSSAAAAANWEIGTTTARPNNFNLGADGFKTIVSGLTYSATGYSGVSGNAFKLDAPATANAALAVGRSLGGQTIDSGTTYVSVLIQKNTNVNRTLNLAFFGGTGAQGTETERLGIGEVDATAGGANGAISMLGNNTNPGQLFQTTGTPIQMGVNTTHLLIAKIDWNAGAGGAENITLWADPTDVTSEAALGTPYISVTQELTNFKYVRVFTGGTAGAFPAVAGTFDEIRIGGALTNVVPEPASLGLIAMASLGMISRRRRQA